jgi:hypothetical protein
MTDHRDRFDGTDPDPDADRWSAWLPPLDPTSDHTGAAGAGQTTSTPPLPQSPGPTLPQSSGLPQSLSPAVPQAPMPAQRAYSSYRSAPPPPASQQWSVAPRRHLGLAIFATFFGFTPLGIVAIVIALSVTKLYQSGRVAQAERASRRARNWALAAIVIRALWTLYYAVFLGS